MHDRRTVLVVVIVWLLSIPARGYGQDNKTSIAAVNGTQLSYEVKGQGHPLVFIHAGVISSSEWNEQFAPFAERYQTIRYDVRGFGKSAARTEPYSNVEDLYQLLRFLKIEKTYVVGGSMGGAIAVDFALEHPEMVDALVLVGPALGGWPYSPAFAQRGYQIILATVAEGPAKGADLWLESSLIPAPQNPAARQQFRQLFIADFHGFSDMLNTNRGARGSQQTNAERCGRQMSYGERDHS